MMCCDMCGKEMNRYRKITISKGLIEYSVAVCPKCSKKLKKFINFEQARNNKRRCEND